MSHLDVGLSKKRKRGERVFKFKNFGENGYPIEFVGPFRENVKALVKYGHLESNFYLCRGLQSWSFQLEVHRHPPFHVLFFIVEEPIEASPNRHCKQCQYVGWGHHLICNKKYHFLLPSKETMLEACFNSKRNSNGNNEEEKYSVNYDGKSKLVELKGHIMHGVFHSNGFGHLLCVNGLEAGSDLAGHLIMDFWDRLCTGLRARKVSLNDISQKRSMELRLIHGIAYNEPWFGRWSYKLAKGSFCVTPQIYQKALESLRAIPLCFLIHHLSSFHHEITLLLSKYQSLSDHSLVNLGDLFHFMLELKSRLPSENCVDLYSHGILIEPSACRWSPKRVEMAIRVIVEALKRAEFRWVSRQEVRDAARVYIGDTGLLDFVLKSLGNHVVGNYLVRRSLNPVTKVLEYCLQDITNLFPNQDMVLHNLKLMARYKVTKVQLLKDMFYLYTNILNEHQKRTPHMGILSAITTASKIVLDSKYLVKEYTGDPLTKLKLGSEEKLNLYCTVTFKLNERLESDTKKLMPPPYECVTLNKNASIDELKLEVERIFREIYWGLKSFVVETVENLNGNGKDLVFGLFEVGSKIVLEGSDVERKSIINSEMCENGENNKRIVDCGCGAKEEDGERMVCCDICEVWQHTRCVHIPNDEEIPHIFLCNRCEQEIVLLPSLP